MKRVVIIGAGVIGLAIARRLIDHNPSFHVTVLERHSEIAREASQHNSGVIHSGIHLDPDSLKAHFARKGSLAMRLYCMSRGIMMRHTGMIVGVGFRNLKTLWGEWRASFSVLRELKDRAFAQGISIKTLTCFGVKRLEPHARVLGGIYIPSVWIIDKKAYAKSLFWGGKKRGVEFRFEEEVFGIKNNGHQFIVRTKSNEYEADILINCAGVYADVISNLARFPGYKIIPWRGEYYEVVGVKSSLIRNCLIYPAVRPGSPGLGIHITKSIDERLFLGPNAKIHKEREYVFEDKTSPREFLEEARCFLPQLEEKDLRWAYAGLRAKCISEGKEADFVIKIESTDPIFINLIGIESPGLSASLPIADHISEVIRMSI